MFGRVLFPTDFSAYANAVFDCLPELRGAGVREVVLLYVIRRIDVPLPETFNRESMERVRWSAEEQLNVARMALEGKGLRVITRIEYGNPAACITRVAEEEQVNLILVGAQGSTIAHEVMLGSVANDVVRRTTKPVLVQKVEVVREMGHVVCRRVCERTFEKILHPTDFSDCSNEAFQIVKRLRAAGAEEVTILHVQDERIMRNRSRRQLTQFDKKDQERLDAMQRALVMYGLKAKTVLRRGIPFQAILEAAEENGPSLIVLGSHGRSLVHEMLIGSTSENVVRMSRLPVLVAPCG